MKKKHLFLFYLLIWTVTVTIGTANASSQIIRLWNGNLILDAHNSNLTDIIKELYEKYSIEIKGLESRASDRINFSFEAETLEILLRSLLRYLGVKSFAIEYLDTTLHRIVVVPETSIDVAAFEKTATDEVSSADPLSVVQVLSIVESSQAEALDLKPGDLILEYDGVRISNTRQLVEEVKKKSGNQQVEMIVMQDQNHVRLFLAGGMIGVRIVTKKISKEDIDFTF